MVIYFGYVFPCTVNETKKAIIVCIGEHLYKRVQENYSVLVNVSKEGKSEHRSKFSNLSNAKEEA